MTAQKKTVKKTTKKATVKIQEPKETTSKVTAPVVMGPIVTEPSEGKSQEQMATETMETMETSRNLKVPSTSPPQTTPQDSSQASPPLKPLAGFECPVGETPKTEGPLVQLGQVAKDMDISAMPALIEYIQSSWLHHAVAMHIKLLCMQCPEALPTTITWMVPRNMDIPALVRQKMASPDYILKIYPVLYMLMGTNIHNKEWAASVATTITLFEILSTITELALHLAQDDKIGL